MHKCDAIVVSCIDFRFQKFIRGWLDNNFIEKQFDYVAIAGGVKYFKTIIEQVEISVRLHNISEVYLINHEDCGVYGKESTFEKHQKDLKITKRKILSKHPNLDINLFYLHLDGTFEQIK